MSCNRWKGKEGVLRFAPPLFLWHKKETSHILFDAFRYQNFAREEKCATMSRNVSLDIATADIEEIFEEDAEEKDDSPFRTQNITSKTASDPSLVLVQSQILKKVKTMIESKHQAS